MKKAQVAGLRFLRSRCSTVRGNYRTTPRPASVILSIRLSPLPPLSPVLCALQHVRAVFGKAHCDHKSAFTPVWFVAPAAVCSC